MGQKQKPHCRNIKSHKAKKRSGKSSEHIGSMVTYRFAFMFSFQLFLFSTLQGLRCLAEGIGSHVHCGPSKKTQLKHATTVTKPPRKGARGEGGKE